MRKRFASVVSRAAATIARMPTIGRGRQPSGAWRFAASMPPYDPANFDACLPWTLAYEGGWSDDPRDPGGTTMCGITQRVYDEDRDDRRLPRQSVRLSTEVERAGIYRRRYWARVRGDDLPGGVDYAA